MLPGPSFEDSQQLSQQQQSRRTGSDKKTVLVFFVGGVTMAEVASLRFLSSQEDSNIDYIIATTSVITGNSFLESLFTKLEAPIF